MLDDFGPTAIEDRDQGILVFFPTTELRDAALNAVCAQFEVRSVEVPDEDWAARSQASLGAVTVGRLIIAPPWDTVASAGSQESGVRSQSVIVIRPSMGFGTGHHATTRLCLAALQTIELAGKTLLDVGTGSGVLAIAAARLGASRVVGLDRDADAITSARENLLLNPATGDVQFRVADMIEVTPDSADVVTANLTGAVLERRASRLLATVHPGGFLIASGILGSERDSVRRAFSQGTVVEEMREEEWVGIVVKKM